MGSNCRHAGSALPHEATKDASRDDAKSMSPCCQKPRQREFCNKRLLHFASNFKNWYLGLLQHRGDALLRRIMRSRRSKSLPNKGQDKQVHAVSHHVVGFQQEELQLFPRCDASSVPLRGASSTCSRSP